MHYRRGCAVGRGVIEGVRGCGVGRDVIERGQGLRIVRGGGVRIRLKPFG